ncbi:hypothetical protein [Pectobacterium actinidiae]|uniref:hypothetical protein n=1 Tax=Pectobacterium actinidiae TaxID=1507808 RepID=UPI00382FE9C7
MNASPHTPRPRAAFVLYLLLWAWMIGLSALVLVNIRVTGDLAGRESFDSAVRQLQVLEGRVAELADDMQALQAAPTPATAAALQDARQRLEARVAQAEQALAGHATEAALQAVRAEMEQLRTQRQAAARTPAPPRPARAAAAAQPEPLPFRVIGMELRAGQRAVSIAPVAGELSIGQIQVVLPGEAIGRWRLQGIDGNTAVFQAGEQTRRLTIPSAP